jgi:molybdopterin-containing oxidoreductase family iron-sulfur binding subunit
MTGLPHLDIAEIRNRLAGTSGKRFWASLEEIIDEASFGKWLEAEFPAAARIMPILGRRAFLKIMGAPLLLATLSGCGEERSDLALPYVNQPEEITPGEPRYYATAVLFEGYAQPMLATTYSGRPTKLDGNPDHPITMGRSDAFMQAAVLQLYDPDRSQGPAYRNEPTTWAAFERALVEMRGGWTADRGQSLRLLCGDVTSPTLARQLQQLLIMFPQSRLHLFEPCGLASRRQATQLAFGRVVDMHYRLENCEVIISLDDDLLGPGLRQVQHARAWSSGRGEITPDRALLRLHIAESMPSLSGVVAASRLPIDQSRIVPLIAAIAAQFGVDTGQHPELKDNEIAWVDQVTRELRAHQGKALLAIGAYLPPAVQAQATVINERLGNVGKTVWYSEPVAFVPNTVGSLRDLARDIEGGAVETLVILDANPAYAAPGDLGFADLLSRVQHTVHAGLFRDETAMRCEWHLPLSHALESWSDGRSADGIATIIQPLLGPLYSVRSGHQLMDMLLGTINPAADSAVRTTWSERFGQDFDQRWRQSLHDGFVAGSAVTPITVTAQTVPLPKEKGRADDAVDVIFRPDPTVWDGRFASVAWLQELPKPLTKLTWENVVCVSPRRGETLGIANGDGVEVAVGGRKVVGPAWIMPGQAVDTVTLFLGYGRRHGAGIGDNAGYDANAIRPIGDSWHAVGSVRRISGREALATMQLHHRMDGFDFVREVTRDHPTVSRREPEVPPTMYPEYPAAEHAWAMAIDLDLCIGCNACVAACTAENNVPVVGKDQVAIGREMLWLRVDRYYTGELDNPRSFFQPVPCMHCEKAPCEMGCPVHATVHSPEGLNQMVFNRCIGTRTCSSYCPYKVRRFNWFDYRAPPDSPLHAAENPDVTVRSRGVMEKCTYCTQRIEAARAKADKENRPIRSGEVITACQAACPTSAIVFGDLNDPQSEVARRRKSGRHYALLEELGTRPRTTYLARWKDEGV